MILLWTLSALHYGERTAAQVIFPTALVLAMLLVAPSLPDNPLNLLTRLAVSTAGIEQWSVPGGQLS